MLVPSTFTGWNKKMMTTKMRPRKTAMSRVQLRNSCRKLGNELFSFGGMGSSWGVSDILCSNLYNTANANAPIALKHRTQVRCHSERSEESAFHDRAAKNDPRPRFSNRHFNRPAQN